MSWRPILAASLSITGLDAGYGAVRVLEDVSLRVGAGETVTLLGTNGNGKSTLMKSVMGMVRPSAGSIQAEIEGTQYELVGRSTEEMRALGASSCTAGRDHASVYRKRSLIVQGEAQP